MSAARLSPLSQLSGQARKTAPMVSGRSAGAAVEGQRGVGRGDEQIHARAALEPSHGASRAAGDLDAEAPVRRSGDQRPPTRPVGRPRKAGARGASGPRRLEHPRQRGHRVRRRRGRDHHEIVTARGRRRGVAQGGIVGVQPSRSTAAAIGGERCRSSKDATNTSRSSVALARAQPKSPRGSRAKPAG